MILHPSYHNQGYPHLNQVLLLFLKKLFALHASHLESCLDVVVVRYNRAMWQAQVTRAVAA